MRGQAAGGPLPAPDCLDWHRAASAYQRPALSKAHLAGTIQADALLLRPEAAYAKLDIGFLGATTVDAIDRVAKTVRLSTGATIAYGHLVLATGGHARRLTCPGANLEGVLALRTLDDVTAIRARMRPGRALVIVGGGYIGLEVAAVAIRQGVAVTILEAAPRVLARVAGAEISAFYESAHRQAGVTILTGANVTALTAPGADHHVGGVALADGRHLATDFVLVGIGLIPNDQLAHEAGLHVQNGIWVDEYCRTEDRAVLAIGDCANHPSDFLARRVRLESMPNAIEQARVAADTIMGKLAPYAAIPWFWSDQYDLKLQAVGLAEGCDQVVVRGDMAIAKRLVGARARPDIGALCDLARLLKALL